MTNSQRDDVKLAVLDTKLDNLTEKVVSMDGKLSASYVTKDEHRIITGRVKLLEKTVYTGIGVILVALIGAGMAALLK